MVFREQHHTSTTQIALQDTFDVELEIVPDSHQQWVIASSGEHMAHEAFRLVEAQRHSSPSNQKQTPRHYQRFRLQPIKLGVFVLTLHYKNFYETTYARQFTLTLHVTDKQDYP